jgi:hypothetical protein
MEMSGHQHLAAALSLEKELSYSPKKKLGDLIASLHILAKRKSPNPSSPVIKPTAQSLYRLSYPMHFTVLHLGFIGHIVTLIPF